MQIGMSMGLRKPGGMSLSQKAMALNLVFAGAEYLDPRVTFSRASAGSRFNSAGLLETSGVNLIYFSTMPGTVYGVGTYPSNWGTTGAYGQNAGLKNETFLGSKVVQHRCTQNAAWEGIQRGAADGVTANKPLVISVYLRVPTGVTACEAAFYSGVGVPSSFVIASAAALNAQPKDAWVRYSYPVTFTTLPHALSFLSMAGPVGSGWDMACPQIEAGSTPTTYAPTGASSSGSPRFDYDPVTYAPLGLLIEEARTNTVVYSADVSNGSLWPQNSVTATTGFLAPDGSNNATLIVPSTGLGYHLVAQSNLSQNGTFTMSAYVKASGCNVAYIGLTGSQVAATFTLVGAGSASWSAGAGFVSSAISKLSNGWYRISVVCTDNVTNHALEIAPVFGGVAWQSYAGDGVNGILAWGVQVEAGGFPSSYIPTTAVPVTRAADVATMTGVGFSSWYNQTEGTSLVQVGDFQPSGTRGAYSINDGSSANKQDYRVTNAVAIATASSTADWNLSSGAPIVQGQKSAVAYAAASVAVSVNGSTPVGSASATPPPVNRLQFGGIDNDFSLYQLNGHIRRFTYYNKRLPDATLKYLTA